MGNSASSEVKKEDEIGVEKNDNDWFGQCCASRKPANRDVVSEGGVGGFGVQDIFKHIHNLHLAHEHTQCTPEKTITRADSHVASAAPRAAPSAITSCWHQYS